MCYDSIKLRLGGVEVPVVGADCPCELPEPLDAIEFGTVWPEEIQPQYIPMCCEPSLPRFSMMPSAIIDHHEHATSFAPIPEELLEEALERCDIESVSFHPGNQTAVMARHCTEDGSGLTGRRMQQGRILLFGWKPPPAPGAMLLEITLVFKPKINAWIAGHATEFLYMPAVLWSQREQSADGVFFGGIPIA